MGLEQFNHRISGNPNGNKLVFLHGVMGSLQNWGRITPAFENDYHILIFDQRGHGRSFKPESGYKASDFAGDLAEILDELGWRDIHLVGHSMGGRNALEFTDEFPARIVKLVVEDIGPGPGREALVAIERLIDLVPTPFPSFEAAKAFFDKTYEGLIQFYPSPTVIRRFLFANLEGKPDGTWDWRFYKPGILEALNSGHDHDQWALIERLRCPTLWLRGEHSTDLLRPEFEEILRRNPHVQGEEIPGSGHWIHFDQPARFIEAVKDFLTLPSSFG